MKHLKISKQTIIVRDDQALRIYLKELSHQKLLTPEEELELSRKSSAGDETARQKLILANLRFVVSVAKHYQNRDMSLTDLINEGNLGLIKAAQKFDESKGFRFISYAVWWIRQSILQALNEKGSLVRIPYNKKYNINKVKNAVRELEQSYHRLPVSEEVENKTGLTYKEVMEAFEESIPHVSTEAFFKMTEDKTLLKDTLEDPNTILPDSKLNKEALRFYLHKSLEMLTPLERQVVMASYGLGGVTQKGYRDLGRELSMSRERVRKIKYQALKKIKTSGFSNSLREFL
jgi:RNA polymerase primary sigma factor